MKTLTILALTLCSTALAAQEVVVKQVNDRRSKGFFSELTIYAELPKIKSTDVAASRVLVTKAVDDTGRDLIDPEKKEPQFENNRGAQPDRAAAVTFALENPERKAMTVKEVRGEIELFMPAKDPNSVAEVAKFLPQSGKPLTHKALKANGIEIALVTPAQLEAEKTKRAEAKKKEYAEIGYEGEALAEMLKSFLESLFMASSENDLYVKIKDPNQRIQEIAYIDGAGEVQQVTVMDDEGMTRLSTWAGKPQADWKLRISMRTPKNLVRYPLALNNVPLP